MKCRFCDTDLKHVFIDLLNSPPSNSFLTAEQLNEPEVYYPLKVFVCDNCFLVQIDEYKKSSEIFDMDYAYFSSYSRSWLDHSHKYVEMITERLKLGPDSRVMEIACNDGYLLQYFVEKKIPCLGIEPAANTARAAREKGIKVIEAFFGEKLASEIEKADLIVGNNVLAHVPDINDFVRGVKLALKPGGTVTMEFPHLLNLIKYHQFDTVYHEHYSYLSLLTVDKIFKHHGLIIFDLEELTTHGGSLRIYATHVSKGIDPSGNVETLISREMEASLNKLEGYSGLQEAAWKIKFSLIEFLLKAQKENKKVAAYGAAAKGNTLLNYCGIKNDMIRFVVDAAHSKQGRYLPGSHVPIAKENAIEEFKPDYIVIFPWNIEDEITKQLAYIKDWGGQFVTVIPQLRIS
jgi:2-polyprenyl-3-methyl-5-hydroxy-6-metoxy-1,4-benzoquinol methylase